MAAQETGNVGRGRPGVPTPIKITIPAFPDGGLIPAKYANTPAGSISPAIEWSGVPEAAVTLALILHDADVPSRPAASTSAASDPDDTLHWVIFNIPARAAGLPEGVPHDLTIEDGSVQLKYVEGVPRLAIGKIGYFGPSPPPSPSPVVASLYIRSLLFGCKTGSWSQFARTPDKSNGRSCTCQRRLFRRIREPQRSEIASISPASISLEESKLCIILREPWGGHR